MSNANRQVRLTILHFNDVYEISPVSGGLQGGLARVAALRQQLLAANPNTLTTFGGDLYNPSGLGKAVVEGEPLAGKQSVAVMNRVGVDYMTFGDHELNTVTPTQFAERLAATEFKLVSSNIFDPTGQPFAVGQQMVKPYDRVTINNEGSPPLRVGIIGLTKPIRLAQVEHRHIEWTEAASSAIAALQGQADILLALTHQPLAMDEALAAQFPMIDVILGGDDHEAVRQQTENGVIYKADSNARRVWVVELMYDTETGQVVITDRCQPITADLPDEPQTQAEITRWVNVGYEAFRAEGWEPTAIVASTSVDLDGLESSVRHQRTTLTDLITTTMQQVSPTAELAIICSWAIRLDDYIPAGAAVTVYDILRMFHDDSPIYTVKVTGDFLQEVLEFGKIRAGSGSYLLTSPNVTCQQVGQQTDWFINKHPLEPTKEYLVAMADDLRTDYLFFINDGRARDVATVSQHTTLQQALIDQLQAAKCVLPEAA